MALASIYGLQDRKGTKIENPPVVSAKAARLGVAESDNNMLSVKRDKTSRTEHWSPLFDGVEPISTAHAGRLSRPAWGGAPRTIDGENVMTVRTSFVFQAW